MKQPKREIVLGMNIQHDSGCCLLINGNVACAISEERLTRVKGAAGGWNAVKYCLESANISLQDVRLAVLSSYGEPLSPGFDAGLSRLGFCGKSLEVDHHLSHACSVFYSSPFEEALIVVVDGAGNSGATESYYLGSGCQITRIGGNRRRETHRGIGKTYEAFTSFLGWTMMESGKTMALAAFGDPERFKSVQLFDIEDDQANGRLKQKYVEGVKQFEREQSLNFGEPFAKDSTQTSRDVAFLIQDRTERALLEIVRYLIRRTGLRKLCLAGGVALNCVANRRLLDEAGVEQMFIVPAASDKGQCLGNAFYGHYSQGKGDRCSFPQRDSWGRRYSNAEIKAVLDLRPELGNNFIVRAPAIEYEYRHDIAQMTAKLLSEGNIVGWFQGESELGPRALGNRSILCSPTDTNLVSRLNAQVKHREAFRPYAPSILEEFASDYFDLACPSPFMLFVARVKPNKRSVICGVVHKDGSARVQTVSRTQNEAFYCLIQEFYGLTDVPVVLNTSFNLAGEPIVESPQDALSVFLRSNMDFLAIGNYLVRRKG
jgi:carbamoyltransferase